MIIKGLEKCNNPTDAVKKLCNDTLQANNIQIASARTIFERNGKVGVAVEFQTEENVFSIFRNVKKIANTTITIERNLTSDKQLDKRVLLKLKKDLRNADREIKVLVRDDRIKIGDQWLSWNDQKELMCGNRSAKEVLQALYGDKLNLINFSYHDIISTFNENNSKN